MIGCSELMLDVQGSHQLPVQFIFELPSLVCSHYSRQTHLHKQLCILGISYCHHSVSHSTMYWYSSTLNNASAVLEALLLGVGTPSTHLVQ